jgi:hypothetical protein
MDTKSYKSIYVQVLQLLENGKYEDSITLLKDKETIRDTLLFRLFYMIYSRKSSPLYNTEKSKERLDGLCKFNDYWAFAEKGRCLLNGILYEQSTTDAEDNFVKAGDEQPMALFYRAEIHFMGLHTEKDGSPIYDLVEAAELYKSLINSTTSELFKENSKIQLSRLMMKNGPLTSFDSKLINGYLVDLRKSGNSHANAVYSEFLIKSFEDVMKDVFDGEAIPNDHESKISMETRRRSCRKALETIKKSINGEM